MTLAKRAMAESKALRRRSYRVAMRLQSLSLPNMMSIRVAPLVVCDGCLALLSQKDAGANPFGLQRVREPCGVMAALRRQFCADAILGAADQTAAPPFSWPCWSLIDQPSDRLRRTTCFSPCLKTGVIIIRAQIPFSLRRFHRL